MVAHTRRRTSQVTGESSSEASDITFPVHPGSNAASGMASLEEQGHEAHGSGDDSGQEFHEDQVALLRPGRRSARNSLSNGESSSAANAGASSPSSRTRQEPAKASAAEQQQLPPPPAPASAQTPIVKRPRTRSSLSIDTSTTVVAAAEQPASSSSSSYSGDVQAGVSTRTRKRQSTTSNPSPIAAQPSPQPSLMSKMRGKFKQKPAAEAAEPPAEPNASASASSSANGAKPTSLLRRIEQKFTSRGDRSDRRAGRSPLLSPTQRDASAAMAAPAAASAEERASKRQRRRRGDDPSSSPKPPAEPADEAPAEAERAADGDVVMADAAAGAEDDDAHKKDAAAAAEPAAEKAPLEREPGAEGEGVGKQPQAADGEQALSAAKPAPPEPEQPAEARDDEAQERAALHASPSAMETDADGEAPVSKGVASDAGAEQVSAKLAEASAADEKAEASTADEKAEASTADEKAEASTADEKVIEEKHEQDDAPVDQGVDGSGSGTGDAPADPKASTPSASVEPPAAKAQDEASAAAAEPKPAAAEVQGEPSAAAEEPKPKAAAADAGPAAAVSEPSDVPSTKPIESKVEDPSSHAESAAAPEDVEMANATTTDDAAAKADEQTVPAPAKSPASRDAPDAAPSEPSALPGLSPAAPAPPSPAPEQESSKMQEDSAAPPSAPTVPPPAPVPVPLEERTPLASRTQTPASARAQEMSKPGSPRPPAAETPKNEPQPEAAAPPPSVSHAKSENGGTTPVANRLADPMSYESLTAASDTPPLPFKLSWETEPAEMDPTPVSISQWVYTMADLQELPSVLRAGYTMQEERLRRARAISFLFKVGAYLRLPPHVLSAACFYFHRFFMREVMTPPPGKRIDGGGKGYQPREVAAAALFLASKTEEEPRKLSHVVEAAVAASDSSREGEAAYESRTYAKRFGRARRHKHTGEIYDYRLSMEEEDIVREKSSRSLATRLHADKHAEARENERLFAPLNWRNAILFNEEMLAATICFDFIVFNPFEYLLIPAKELGVDLKTLQVAWLTMIDCARDPIYIVFQPPVLAAGVFKYACEALGVDPQSFVQEAGAGEGETWMHHFDVTIPERVEEAYKAIVEAREVLIELEEEVPSGLVERVEKSRRPKESKPRAKTVAEYRAANHSPGKASPAGGQTVPLPPISPPSRIPLPPLDLPTDPAPSDARTASVLPESQSESHTSRSQISRDETAQPPDWRPGASSHAAPQHTREAPEWQPSRALQQSSGPAGSVHPPALPYSRPPIHVPRSESALWVEADWKAFPKDFSEEAIRNMVKRHFDSVAPVLRATAVHAPGGSERQERLKGVIVYFQDYRDATSAYQESLAGRLPAFKGQGIKLDRSRQGDQALHAGGLSSLTKQDFLAPEDLRDQFRAFFKGLGYSVDVKAVWEEVGGAGQRFFNGPLEGFYVDFRNPADAEHAGRQLQNSMMEGMNLRIQGYIGPSSHRYGVPPRGGVAGPPGPPPGPAPLQPPHFGRQDNFGGGYDGPVGGGHAGPPPPGPPMGGGPPLGAPHGSQSGMGGMGAGGGGGGPEPSNYRTVRFAPPSNGIVDLGLIKPPSGIPEFDIAGLDPNKSGRIPDGRFKPSMELYRRIASAWGPVRGVHPGGGWTKACFDVTMARHEDARHLYETLKHAPPDAGVPVSIPPLHAIKQTQQRSGQPY